MSGLLVAAFLAATSAGADIQSAVAKHGEMLAKIRTIHIKYEIKTRAPGEEFRTVAVAECWRSGSRQRVVNRKFERFVSEGLLILPEASHGDVSITSAADGETRYIVGWDPEHPNHLPLDLNDHLRIRCQILPTDPKSRSLAEWSALQLDPTWRQSLSSLFASGKAAVRPAPAPGIVRFELGGGNIKDASARVLQGCVFDLDANHGYYIRRMELTNDFKMVGEVEKFLTFDDGICIAGRVRRSGPTFETVTEVITCEVNSKIPNDKLAADFPEGAFVLEKGKQAKPPLFHIWGKQAAAKTFRTMEEYRAYLASQTDREVTPRQSSSPEKK